MSTADDAWQANRALSHLWLDKQEAFIHGHDEGYRRALEDAAEVVKSRFEHGRLTTDECELVETWLRDRAAGVGTKDGDDDE